MATRALRCSFFVPGCFDTGTRLGWILPRQHRGTRRGSWVLWSRCSACRPSGDRSIKTNQDGEGDDANDDADNDHCNNGDDKPHIYTSKVLSTRPHTQKLQYYGAAKTPFSSKLDTLPTGQVRLMNYCDVIIFHLLGSASTESFCWTSARGGELSKWAIEHRQHEHRCPCFFKHHLTTRWGEGGAPGPCTCTSNPSLRFPTSYLILHSPCLDCNPLYEKLSLPSRDDTGKCVQQLMGRSQALKPGSSRPRRQSTSW